MSEEAARTYVDRLFEEGFSVDVTDNDVVIIIDPIDTKSVVNARDPRRGLDLIMHKEFVVSYLRELGRLV